MPFTAEQDIFLVEAYFRSGELQPNGEWKYSTDSSRHQFHVKYTQIEFQYDIFARYVHRLISRFRETGSLAKKHAPGKPSLLTEEVLGNIQEIMDENPNKSIRRLSIETGLSYATCHKATEKLHLHPYKVSIVQQLLPPDYEKCTDYCAWFNNNLNDDNFLDITFFRDEAWFHLSSYVNSQNYRHWSSVNPHVFVEDRMHPLKIGVWCAMSRRRIIGPIFFHDTINAVRYRTLILEPFIEQLHDDEMQFGYFQQDGATAHTAYNTITYLQEYFDNRLVSRNRWPPRSPDLTPLDFFLFGYLKNTIYRNPIHTLQELQDAITNAINDITEETLVDVFDSIKRRVNVCLESKGHHLNTGCESTRCILNNLGKRLMTIHNSN